MSEIKYLLLLILIVNYLCTRKVSLIVKNERYFSLDDPASYDTYLKTCPEVVEVKAIAKVKNWCESYKCRCHIVHLSSATALSLIREAKEKQLPLTVETCFHYLCVAAEKIPHGATEFKCCPPIRNETNREKLWAALQDHTLDMVVSDHSPCTEDLKVGGNYLKAWGGISSLQFGLSLLWTEARNRDFSLQDIVRVLCSGPAKLSGFEHRKGSLRIGMDADFVVWNPDETIEVQRSGTYHKNTLSPYIGEKLFGKVCATVIRGNTVYKNGEFCDQPLGQLLLKDAFLSNGDNV